MRKLLAVGLIIVLALGCLPGVSLGASKQMRDGVPVWTEDTVKQYALDFIHGNDMERLFSYYDLQIRRYMPMDTFTAMLTEIEWMTGDFVEFGTYSSMEEPEQKTKTHVLHLCMEKQDLDLYFTHKNKEEDWEIMAVEFVPAAKQETTAKDELLVTDGDSETEDSTATESAASFTETAVKVGAEPYLLDGILTMPKEATSLSKVPGVVLVAGEGPYDMDETIGKTKLMADVASAFAKKGVATLRFDQRAYVYGDAMTEEQLQNFTVEEGVIQDAISAGAILKQNELIDQTRIVLMGHDLGAMLAPRIVSESDGVFTAMILVAGSPKSLLEVMLSRLENTQDSLTGDALTQAEAQAATLKEEIATLKKISSAKKAKETTIEGVNGYYYWEMMQGDPCKLIKTLKAPTYIVQGNADYQLALEDGIEAYEDVLASKYNFVDYKTFRKLNHLLMLYQGPGENKGSLAEYDTSATLEKQAGRNLADWVLALSLNDEDGE